MKTVLALALAAASFGSFVVAAGLATVSNPLPTLQTATGTATATATGSATGTATGTATATARAGLAARIEFFRDPPGGLGERAQAASTLELAGAQTGSLANVNTLGARSMRITVTRPGAAPESKTYEVMVETAGTVLVMLTPTDRQPLEAFLRSRGFTVAAGGAVGLGPNPTP